MTPQSWQIALRESLEEHECCASKLCVRSQLHWKVVAPSLEFMVWRSKLDSVTAFAQHLLGVKAVDTSNAAVKQPSHVCFATWVPEDSVVPLCGKNSAQVRATKRQRLQE